MKFNFSFLILLFLGCLMNEALKAQVPQFINFQCIASDDIGEVMTNTSIQIRLTVIDSALGGQQVYQELRAAQTNNKGSFSFQIGKNPDFTPIGIFKNINWLSGNKYLKVDYDPTNSLNFNYSLGFIKIVSVPYALTAANIVYIDSTGVQNGQTLIFNAATGLFEPGAVQSGNLNAGQGLNITGNTISNTGDLNNTNEIQQLSSSNDTIFLTQGGGFAFIPPQGNVNLLSPYAEILTPVGIAADSVTLRGIVNPKGMATHATFEWGKTTALGQTAQAAQSPIYGMSNVNVSVIVNGLDYATTYHYRMKAINAVGDTVTATGSFTAGTDIPSLQTLEVSQIKGSSATVTVHVTNNGGMPVSARGVCWSTSPLPLVTGIHTTETGDTGVFNTVMTGLDTCTEYYVRAYATNALGTAYGQAIKFNSGYTISFPYAGGLVFYNDGAGRGLIASPIPAPGTSSFGCQGQLMGTSTSIYSGENNTALILANCSTNTCAHIASDFSYGGFDDWYLPSRDEISLVYGTLQAQNLVNYPETNYASSSESDSNNFWYQNFSYGPLLPYFKDWAYYSILPIRTFSTACVPIYPPVVSTVQVYQISSHAAKCTGVVIDNGGSFVTAKGICWSSSPIPSLSDSFSTNGSSNDAFTTHITGLHPDSTYYARAYATNSAGTAYGNILSFRTYSETNRIYTFNPTGITGARCTTGGHIADDMGDSITTRGICYKTTHDPSL